MFERIKYQQITNCGLVHIYSHLPFPHLVIYWIVVMKYSKLKDLAVRGFICLPKQETKVDLKNPKKESLSGW